MEEILLFTSVSDTDAEAGAAVKGLPDGQGLLQSCN